MDKILSASRSHHSARPYDALLVVSFGGPEQRDDVIPFLENVLRGKPVPRERMLEVAEHYYHFGGVSPINAQCREFIAALKVELQRAGIHLPVYWGNRNWHPLLTETVAEMTAAGMRRVLAFVMSAYSSYSGCRQYRENIAAAQAAAGESAPAIEKIRVFYNHPEFIAANAERVSAAISALPQPLDGHTMLLFTAHSIPLSMAKTSDYEAQLLETCRLVSETLHWPANRWRLVYQSRSGRPTDPWLEPDVGDALRELAEKGTRQVVIAPVGFLSDHLEVLYDLDYEAHRIADGLGVSMVRAGTVGTHPRFVRTVRELIEERLGRAERRAIGQYGPRVDECRTDCCLKSESRP